MKVRISGNKIRFRLKEPEVRKFQQRGTISEVLEFGNDQGEQLKFTLSTTQDQQVSIQFQSNETTILIPKAQADDWALSDLIGFDHEVETGKGKTISILVEKDFVCMDGREEDNAGSYPNPLADIN
jgi:hypothetical protein